MGWLKSLFRKEKEIETVYVELSKLSAWFDEQTEPLLEIIKDDMHAKLKEIRLNCDRAKESAKVLEEAKLRNDKIPERAIQVMEGNRDAYIKSVNIFLGQIKIPSAINIGNVTDFLSRFEENLDYFTKTSSKSYYILQEFFKDESGAIALYIKKVDVLIRSLLDNEYKKINTVREKISEVDNFLALRRKASDLVEEEKTNFNSINAVRRETTDKIENLEQSRDFKELKEIEEEKKKTEKEIKSNEAEIISLFSPVKKSMKKYSKIAVDGEDILKNYLDSSLAGLMKDESFRIIDVLAKMKGAVQSDQLDLKDKKKEKTLEALNNITKQKLEEYARRHYELVDSMEKLKRRESINTASQKLNELNYKLAHLDSQLERSKAQIEKLQKQMEKTDMKKMLSEIEKDAHSLLSVRLKIRWKDETAQESA